MKPLPSNPKDLERLLEVCEDFAQFANKMYQIHAFRYEALVAKTIDNARFASMQAKLAEVDLEAQNIRPAPAIVHLMPFVGEELDRIYAKYPTIDVAQLPELTQRAMSDETVRSRLLEVYSGAAHSFLEQASLLELLKAQIQTDLGRGQTDTAADTAKNLADAAPRNDDIMLLHLRIERELGPGTTKKAIAIEFTDGDEKKADSLLKGVRRLKQRLGSRGKRA